MNHFDAVKKAVLEELDDHRAQIDARPNWVQIRITIAPDGLPINTIWQQEERRDLRGMRVMRLTGK